MSVWNTAFEASPAGGDSPALGDDKIREVKSAMRERYEKEHIMNLSSGLAVEDGWHKNGSSMVYYGSVAPTLRPDGVTSLNANDYGRTWVKTTDFTLWVYDGSSWVAVGAFAADTHGRKTYLGATSVNWVCPPGITKLLVSAVAQGGAGAAGSAGVRGGGGGGAGAWCRDLELTVTPGVTYAITLSTSGASSIVGTGVNLQLGKGGDASGLTAGSGGTGSGGASNGGSGGNGVTAANGGGGGGGGIGGNGSAASSNLGGAGGSSSQAGVTDTSVSYPSPIPGTGSGFLGGTGGSMAPTPLAYMTPLAQGGAGGGGGGQVGSSGTSRVGSSWAGGGGGGGGATTGGTAGGVGGPPYMVIEW